MRIGLGLLIGLAGCLTINNNSTPGPSPAASSRAAEDAGPAPMDAAPSSSPPSATNDAASPMHTTGTYFASCLTELANGQTTKTLSYYAETLVQGDDLSLTLHALALVNRAPPTTVATADEVGDPLLPFGSPLGVDGSFSAFQASSAALVFSPGAANPISGSDLVISSAKLKGRFAANGFCVRIAGHVTEPTAAARDLDETKNFCLFTPTTDGAAAPAHAFTDYSTANCPD